MLVCDAPGFACRILVTGACLTPGARCNYRTDHKNNNGNQHFCQSQNPQVLQLVGPRVEPVAASLRHAAAQRTQLLRAARSVLAGLQDDVGQLVRELEGRGPCGDGGGAEQVTGRMC